MDQDDEHFLIATRNIVADGRSVYGPIGSPKQVEKMAELDARIAHGRHMGEVPPAAEPWGMERVAKERLAHEFKFGDPSATPIHEAHGAMFRGKLEALAGMPEARLAIEQDALAKDVKDFGNTATLRHSAYRPSDQRYLGGHEIVNALVEDAEPAIRQFAQTDAEATALVKLCRTDRSTLEYFATRGRSMTSYSARAKELGL